MVIVMKFGASPEDIKRVEDEISAHGLTPKAIRGEERTVICALGDEAKIRHLGFEGFAGVESASTVTKPYKLVSHESRKDDTVFNVRDAVLGGKEITLIAGPCSVEKPDLMIKLAHDIKAAGAKLIRGGAFKPRTSPYDYQGSGEDGLKILADCRAATGLGVITEVMDTRDIELIGKYTDVFQVGARNMQNFSLLKELGKQPKPVLLKRGLSAQIKEWFMAAEYLMSGGNTKVILCERGIRTFETMTRNTFDVAAVPVAKKESHLPVFVDPSHAAGIRGYVEALALAAVAAGADGLLIEVHPDPDRAQSDAAQTISLEAFAALAKKCQRVAQAVDRTVSQPPAK